MPARTRPSGIILGLPRQPALPSRSAWRPAVLLATLALLSSCASFGRSTPRAAVPARRLVLALDGIDYRDVMAARAKGLFRQFREPSRLISTFPSISDIAWHEIFNVQPPRGYQRIYYSTAYNDVMGAPLDAIRPIEFEDRMDMAFGAKFHHLSAYVASNTVARHEVDVAVRDFFKISDRQTVYVYNVGPDALQHTRGDLDRYLRHLDQRLNELQATYRERTGRSLEIVVLSDHGHNRGVNAKFLAVTRGLEAHGFRAASQLRTPTDVAFSVDGVTTGFGVFAAPESVAAVSRILLDMDGVDLVSTRLTDSTFLVRRDSSSARLERRMTTTGMRYRYVSIVGDPLRLVPVVHRMAVDGVSVDGFADSRAWVQYSATSDYPAAVERIVRGHTSVTLNPAPILVSLADGFRVGLGMVSVANRMRPLGGTHGALSATNSLGVLMTTFAETHDDITTTVREQLGAFADLAEPRVTAAGARLTSAALLTADPRGTAFARGVNPLEPRSAPLLEIWLTAKDVAWMGADGALLVQMRPAGRGDLRGDSVGTSYLPLASLHGAAGGAMTVGGWYGASDRRRFVLPVSALYDVALRPSQAYEVRVIVDRFATRGRMAEATSRVVATLALRTNDRGELWPY